MSSKQEINAKDGMMIWLAVLEQAVELPKRQERQERQVIGKSRGDETVGDSAIVGLPTIQAT